ncbi:acyltransferase family protein [Cellulomonas sp. PhB150]|uniref:acyltransferase family protein n=1 Tax=Cellulomonas sp. PhB150 TaxID=2485188 RepID=UPI000F49397B|nr:acyltransferase family protein [Cellulomonas sp. PhB150]ROS27937.1 peptidoglycan/LPS O-acetylase OafA/YrhL [Cellulomonas sp. PhB150]
MTTTQTRLATPGAKPRGKAAFRPDIQGMRAIAVVLVLLFHAGFPGLSGGFVGVDVFFVISGYLITSMIVTEVLETGRLRLGRFYARRARRLLPAASTVLVAVAVMTVLWLPVTRWREIAGDMASTALYVVNWRLAARSVDYLAEGDAASPVQHFWSLAVEEQFYILWPVLVLLVVWWARRRGVRVTRRVLGVAILAIAVPSLAWSVHATSATPQAAYFVTTTRLWELAVGALLAVGATRVARLPQRLLAVTGFVGLALIAYAAVRFDGSTPFPGVAALVPTLGAAAVLAAGLRDGRGLRVLALPGMATTGAMSYSLYLWHWPAIVLATTLWADDSGHLRIRVALAAILLSVVPAWLSYRFVEQPLHLSEALRRSVKRSAAVGVACTLVGLAAAGAVLLALLAPASGANVPHPGAAVIGTSAWTGVADATTDVSRIAPALADAKRDVADSYSDGCHQTETETAVKPCRYGPDDATVVVALVGDSHAEQWEPTLREVAEQQGWRLDTYIKSSCAVADVDQWLRTIPGPYDTCTTWADSVTKLLVADPPTVVVSSNDGIDGVVVDGVKQPRESLESDFAAGLARTWEELEAAGSTVVALADTPRSSTDIPECVAKHEKSWATECETPREKGAARSAVGAQERAAKQADVPLIDLTDAICPAPACPAIIGNVLVWRDSHHMTATYARTLAPRLTDALVPIVAAS